jgi:hypothetical protein
MTSTASPEQLVRIRRVATPSSIEDRYMQMLVEDAYFRNSTTQSQHLTDEIGDDEIRRKIKESTGFDYDEIMLGLKDEPKGMREFQRLQSPMPSHLTEREQALYQKLFRDLSNDIQLIKDEIFNVENRLRECIDLIESGKLQGQELTEKNKKRITLESQHVALILRLSQAEDAYKSLRNNIERQKFSSDLKQSIGRDDNKSGAPDQKPEEELVQEDDEAQLLTKAAELISEKKRSISQQKLQFVEEQELARQVNESYKKEAEEWRRKRLEHRNVMMECINACQVCISINNTISNKQILETNRRSQ